MVQTILIRNKSIICISEIDKNPSSNLQSFLFIKQHIRYTLCGRHNRIHPCLIADGRNSNVLEIVLFILAVLLHHTVISLSCTVKTWRLTVASHCLAMVCRNTDAKTSISTGFSQLIVKFTHLQYLHSQFHTSTKVARCVCVCVGVCIHIHQFKKLSFV